MIRNMHEKLTGNQLCFYKVFLYPKRTEKMGPRICHLNLCGIDNIFLCKHLLWSEHIVDRYSCSENLCELKYLEIMFLSLRRI